MPDQIKSYQRAGYPGLVDIRYRGGHLMLDANGVVESVFVPDELCGQGIATAMWQYAVARAAKRGTPAPCHAAERTTAGDGWARKVGGALPPRIPITW